MPGKRAADTADGIDSDQAIKVHLDTLLAERGMTLTELSELVGITLVNLSVLKNGHARAIRFSTLAAICGALECQPGDILTWRDPGGSR
jgi:putative transcriptional regulator